MNNIKLIPHPATPCPAIHTLNATVERLADGDLRLRYTLRGDVAQVLIPAPQPPVFTDGLWQHTCFEAFVAVEGETAYREFNFSPSASGPPTPSATTASQKKEVCLVPSPLAGEG
jgi:hypothetical protein